MPPKHVAFSPENSATEITTSETSFDDELHTPIMETKKKVVRFEKNVRFESSLQIKIVPYKVEDIKSRWYGRPDLFKFQIIDQRLKNQILKAQSDNDSTSRLSNYDLDGFECPMLSVGSCRYTNQEMRCKTTIKSILQAQERQEVQGLYSSTYISTTSKRLSKKHKKAAYEVGLRNEKYVSDYCFSKIKSDQLNLEKIADQQLKESLTFIQRHQTGIVR